MTATLYDMTMDLKDEYTSLVSRVLGEQLQVTLYSKLSACPSDDGVLLLDFSVVTSVHESFVDEFLVPVLKSLERGEAGDKYIVGVNVDQERLNLKGIDDLMQRNNLLFLTFLKDGGTLLLGSPNRQSIEAIEFVHKSEKETAAHLAVQLNVAESEAQSILSFLGKHRVIRERHAQDVGLDFFQALLDSSERTRLLKHSFQEELLERIDRQRAIERNAHYQLPSGYHAEEFLHLSRVLDDARFSARIAVFLADAFKNDEIDVILTVKTPNNLVLAQGIGDYLDAKVVPAILDQVEARLVPASNIRLKQGDRALILVDVIGTGWVVNLLLALASNGGANVEGIAAVVDLSEAKVGFTLTKTVTAASLTLKMYSPGECPLCAQKIPWIPARILPRA
ncbi:MAG TPA: hypothetical protein VG028_06200 [Terriglobia bacterium]|nr:hypothetical protein [Terriglobia bacterium]